MTRSIAKLCHNGEYQYDDCNVTVCHYVVIIILIIILLYVIMLSVIMLNVVRLSIIAVILDHMKGFTSFGQKTICRKAFLSTQISHKERLTENPNILYVNHILAKLSLLC